MNNARALVASSENAPEEWEDMFSHLPEMDMCDLKKDQIAAELAALMSFSGKSRSEMADCLNWEKSRVTRVLSGRANLTVKTIQEYCSALGYDFDVIFRLSTEDRAKQPWQKCSSIPVPLSLLHSVQDYEIRVDVQTASEVAFDLQRGQGKSHYISLGDSRPQMKAVHFVEVGAASYLPVTAALTDTRRMNVIDVIAKRNSTSD